MNENFNNMNGNQYNNLSVGMNSNMNSNFNNMHNQVNVSNSKVEEIRKKLNRVHNINMHKKKKLHMTKKKTVFLSSIALFLLVVLVILGLFTYSRVNGYTRTIMIYMSGADLESNMGLATSDLSSIDFDEMDNKNIKVIVMAGGSEKWHNGYIDNKSTSIYELTESGFEIVKKNSLLNMGESSTLTKFINYVTDNYHSEKYSLIFWNHGGAMSGTNNDFLFNHDSLLLPEIDKALLKTKFKNKKLENVIFRTCLNGTIEYADLFAKYADYMIASEELTIGMNGYSVLNYINNINVMDDSYEVGMKFVDAYKKQVDGIRNSYIKEGIENLFDTYSTYSIVDLNKVDDLVHKLNNFMNDIDVNSNFEKIAKVRANLFQYGGKNNVDTIDLYTFVDNLKYMSPEKGAAVLEAFDEAVLYNWATNKSSRGLSIYFPYTASDNVKKSYLELYSKIDSLDNYNEIISGFYLLQSTGGNKSLFNFDSNSINVEDNGSSADFSIELTDEQKSAYANARYFVFRKEDNGEFWPFYIGNSSELVGNKVVANISGRGIEIFEPDTNSYETIPLMESYENESYIKYDVSVYLEKYKSAINSGDVESATLSVNFYKNTGEISLGDLVYYVEGSTSNIAVDLNDYSHIVIGSTTYNFTDEYGNVSFSNMKTGSYYYGIEVPINDIKLRLSNYKEYNKEFYAVFDIKDIYNNSYNTDLVKMN